MEARRVPDAAHYEELAKWVTDKKAQKAALDLAQQHNREVERRTALLVMAGRIILSLHNALEPFCERLPSRSRPLVQWVESKFTVGHRHVAQHEAVIAVEASFELTPKPFSGGSPPCMR